MDKCVISAFKSNKGQFLFSFLVLNTHLISWRIVYSTYVRLSRTEIEAKQLKIWYRLYICFLICGGRTQQKKIVFTAETCQTTICASKRASQLIIFGVFYPLCAFVSVQKIDCRHRFEITEAFHHKQLATYQSEPGFSEGWRFSAETPLAESQSSLKQPSFTARRLPRTRASVWDARAPIPDRDLRRL